MDDGGSTIPRCVTDAFFPVVFYAYLSHYALYLISRFNSCISQDQFKTSLTDFLNGLLIMNCLTDITGIVKLEVCRCKGL